MRPPRPRHIVRGGLLACALVAPAVAESASLRALDGRLARCTDGDADARCGGVEDVEIDALGLRLRNVWIERDGVRARIAAVHVEPHPDGVRGRLEGLEARVERPRRDMPRADAARPRPRGGSTSPATTPIERRIPWSIEAMGTVTAALDHGVELVVTDPFVRWRPGEGMESSFEASVRHPRLSLASHGPLRARKPVGGAWELEGAGGIDGGLPLGLGARTDGSTVDLRVVSPGGGTALGARTDGSTVDLRVVSPGGGTADLHVPLAADARTVTVRATKFSAGALKPLERLLPAQVGLEHARVDGHVGLSRTDAGVRVELDELSIANLDVHDRRLSRAQVRLGQLVLDGTVDVGRERLRADVRLAHGRARGKVTVTHGGDRTHFGATLEPLACQDLLDSLPAGLIDVVDGMELAGELDASLALEMDAAEVAAWLERERSTGDEHPPPGTLAVSFPFLERCRVVRDAPVVDLDALRGPYRHRFVDDSGAHQHRVLARGVRGFVPLAAVPNLSQAFVTLEDSRFWAHDGFDRKQIERALWHNLGARRIQRGASTITQQTARNLWLGIDRSLARKLQEALLASRLEAELSKQRILELYMNIIELGPQTHGVAEAAQYHFGKRAEDLNLLEAVHLAALAPGPRLYSKRFAAGKVDDEWIANLRRQITRMHLHGLITKEQARTARRQRLRLIDHTKGPA